MRNPQYIIKSLKNAMACLKHGDTKETLGLLKTTRDIAKGIGRGNFYTVYTFEYQGNLRYHDFMACCRSNSRLPDEYYRMIETRKQTKEKTMSKPAKGYLVVNISMKNVETTSCYSVTLRPRARPSMVHTTKEKAETEAQRLSNIHRGETFMVFETCSAFVVQEPITRFTY